MEAFEQISSQVGRLPEEQYLGYFMSGLKPQVRRRVRTFNPKSRMEMMKIAMNVEEELLDDEEGDDTGRNVKGNGSYKVMGGSKSHYSGSGSKSFNLAQQDKTRS